MAGPFTPEISVVIPAYNMSTYIGRAILSLKSQSFVDFEGLIIDDGSTDDTSSVARLAIADDSRFRIIHQPNQGLSVARNTGLDQAKGRFLAFLDGDDRFDPDFLSVLHGDIVQSGAAWVACGVSFCPKDGKHHGHSAIHGRPVPEDPPVPRDYSLSDWPSVICHFPSAWNKLYRRDLIGDLRFDPGTWFEDHAFFLRLAAKSNTLRHIPRSLYLYTLEREGQITGTDSERVFEQFEVLATAASIMAAADKPGAKAGLARLATRLCNERLDAIADPERTGRFFRTAIDFFARHQLAPDWAWDPYLNAARSAALSGTPPITIRLSSQMELLADFGLEKGGFDPLFERIAAVAEQSWSAPSGGVVLDLPKLGPMDHAALIRAADMLLRSDCAAVVLPCLQTTKPHALPGGRSIQDGPTILTPQVMISLDATEMVLLTKNRYLRPLDGSNHETAFFQQAALIIQAGGKIFWHNEAVSPATNISVPSISQRRRSLQTLAALLPPDTLPVGWDRRLFLRTASARLADMYEERITLWNSLHRIGLVVQVWWIGLMSGWIGTPGEVDPTTHPLLRRILRLPSIR